MPRRIFTADDLAPLRVAAQQVIERQPDAALVAAAAEPIKRRIPTPAHEELADVRLPVDVASSASPQGVPLHEIAKAVQEEAPSVTGVALTPEGLTLKFDKAPTAAQQRKITALLGDKARLEGLASAVGVVSAPMPGAPAPSDEQLLEVLRDPQTSDAAWLRAFRSWAAAHLLEPPAKPAAKPRAPRKNET